MLKLVQLDTYHYKAVSVRKGCTNRGREGEEAGEEEHVILVTGNVPVFEYSLDSWQFVLKSQE